MQIGQFACELQYLYFSVTGELSLKFLVAKFRVNESTNTFLKYIECHNASQPKLYIKQDNFAC